MASYGTVGTAGKRRNSSAMSLPMDGLPVKQNLYELAKEGNLALVREFADVRVCDSSGGNPLHAAASNDQVEVMQYLIDSGISLNATDKKGNTALHIATQNVCLRAVDLLMEKKANDTILNQEMEAPLHIAVCSKNLELVKVFLNHPHAELVVHGYRKRTALHIAAELNLMEIVDAINTFQKMTKFHVCAQDVDGITPIHLSARCGSHAVLDLMIITAIEQGCSYEELVELLDKENSTPLHTAVDAGYLESVCVLLKHNASPTVQNGDQLSPINLACRQGKLGMVQAIINKHGSGILHCTSTDGSTALHWAARGIQNSPLVNYLIEQGAPVNAITNIGLSPLFCAIISGRDDLIATFITSGADVYQNGPNKRNIFHYAIQYSHSALPRLISNANLLPLLHQPNADGFTPVHQACKSYSDNNIARLLIDSLETYSTNTKDSHGNNYLHILAAAKNHNALEKALSISQADTLLSERNCRGETPLHSAAATGCIKCIQLLLDKGAVFHRCHEGKSPFLISCLYGHEEAADILLQAHPQQRDWVDENKNSALHYAAISGKPAIVLKCLDTGIRLTHNNDGDTFLDLILQSEAEDCAMAVVKHDRWQECLDYPAATRQKPPFVQMVERMPKLAKAVLDRCHICSNLPQESPTYWEEFNLKYTYQNVSDQNEQPSDRIQSSLVPMAELKRADLVTHPVTNQFLKAKWKAYGKTAALIQLFQFLMHSLLLSVFIAITPPPRLNISAAGELIESNTTKFVQLSIASNILRLLVLFATAINGVIIFTTLISLGHRIFKILRNQYIWLQIASTITTFTFLIPWRADVYGLDSLVWEAGALAVFFSWCTIIVYMGHFEGIGVYFIMFTEVSTSITKVMFVIVLPFFLAFSQSFYILLGEFIPFKNIGQSFLTMLAYLFGEIEYVTIISRHESGILHYPGMTYIFISLAASLLGLTLMNLLIGLAVGDIEKIRSYSIVKQRIDKILIISEVDRIMSQKFKRLRIESIRVYPNRKRNPLKRLWLYSSKTVSRFGPSIEDKDTSNNESDKVEIALLQQEKQLKQLEQQIIRMMKKFDNSNI